MIWMAAEDGSIRRDVQQAGDEQTSPGVAVHVEGLRKRFGGLAAVAGVCFDLRPGEIVALIGPNGAGKTTIFNLITNSIPPDEGVVEVGGRNVAKMPPQKIVGAGMVRSWQHVRLFGSMTALENVMLAIPNQPSERLWPVLVRPRTSFRREREVRSLALEYLAFVGLTDAASTQVSDLSFGQQKAIAIARVLATGAQVLLLDEPTSGIDPRSVDDAIELVRKVAATGRSVCIVEHSLHVVEALADRVVFLEAGTVRAEGTVAEITCRPELADLYFGRQVCSSDVEAGEDSTPATGPVTAVVADRPPEQPHEKDGQDVLRITSLRAGYGKRDVLMGVDLRIKPGQIVTVVGHNGAGKTTLLKSVLGLVPRRTGVVEFFGEDIMGHASYSNVRRGISLTQAETPVFRPLSVRENLRLAAHATGAAREAERVESVFELFPRLRERTSQRAGTLSGGEQRMLALGMALMGNPRLMLLDEPSLGLAPALVNQVFEVIRGLCEREGIAVLLVEQQVRAALEIADYVYFLRLGRIAHHETVAEAASRPDYWSLF
jgi:ABC-type branched-subunit amino acid transport system ATPase component